MSFLDDLTNGIKKSIRGDIDSLLKGDGDMLPENPEAKPTNTEAIGQKAVIDDPYFDQVHQHFIFKNKMSRLSNKTLKDTSIRDWVVSSIIQARVDTLLQFSRPQHEKFKMGFEVVKRDRDSKITPEDKENMANLEDFIYNCGRTKNTPPGKEMNFGEFMKLTCRDALTFGHVSIEKVLTRTGGLHRFRPLPSESVYVINQKTSREIIEKELESAKKTYENQMKAQSNQDPAAKHKVNEVPIEYYKYVQMSYDNRVMAAFGDEDFIFQLFNPQNFADSLGYCYSPLELAIINVTNHLNVENYNANFFTHGYAARGILHLKGTVTQSQLTAFRRQFYNTISGAQHAWRTPIIAGLDDVQWVQLAGNAREMEYLNYNNHIIRALCSQFQIDPMELGLDTLLQGGKTTTQGDSNMDKVTYSRERGLYPILMMFEDLVNSKIIPALDKGLAKEYKFQFVGYTDETAQTNVAQAQAEMTTTASINDLFSKVGKEKIEHPAADLPMNEAFWGVVEKNMTRGEIRETFFGDKGASQRRELQYIPADPAFMGWQQLLMTLDQTKQQAEQMAQQAQAEQQQAEQEQADREHEKAIKEKQDQREQEAHDLEQKEADARHAHAAVTHKSLKDTAKEIGFASKPLEVGGKTIANPINSDLADE
jgi:hypothetical protein